MAQKIQLRRGISTTWTADNPELAQGEIGIETNTGKFKIGDGIHLWNALSYATVTPDDLATEIATAISEAALGSTDDLTEGVQNLYFHNQLVSTALNSGSLQNISFTYHSGSNTIDVSVPTVQGTTGTQGEHKERKAHRVLKVSKVHKVRLVPKAPKEFKAPQAHKEQQEHKGQQVKQVPKV